jgi:hypothetical protein
MMTKSFVTKAKTALQETMTFSHHTLRPQKHPLLMMNKITGHLIMHSFHPCPQVLPYLNQKFLAGCWGLTSVIIPTQGSEIRMNVVLRNSQENSSRNPISKKPIIKNVVE